MAQYRQALAAYPMLHHVWVQLGHALGQLGRLDEARAVYEHAVDLAPDDRDPVLHLAHINKRLGNPGRAAELYAALVRRDVFDREAVAETASVLRHLTDAAQAHLLEPIKQQAKRELEAGDQGDDWPSPIDDRGDPPLVFDVSDLISFFDHARRPTGIQRVQIETVSAALAISLSAGRAIVICCMTSDADHWKRLPAAVFSKLASASLAEEGPGHDWQRAHGQLRLSLLFAEPYRFPVGAILLNLGASWALGNYFLALRSAVAERDIRYIPFVHDLIPIVAPQHHTAELIEEFTAWLLGALHHADGFLVNSAATRRDLLQVIQLAGQGGPGQDVAVIPLDARSGRSWKTVALPDSVDPDGFVLFVGTIEPRKGHDTALAAWSLLLSEGPCPQLVVVGRNGWMSTDFYARLNEDFMLAGRVLILSDVADPTLDALYRNALFTIYPSTYEGWGLPVTESLSRGKAVITTTASSLPEAGGALAVYVDPDDPGQLAAAVRHLTLDVPYRQELERRITEEFKPRSWSTVAEDVIGRSIELAAGAPPRLPVARCTPGRFYTLAVQTTLAPTAGVSSGEFCRFGAGWSWPDQRGCRLRAEKAALLFRPDLPGPGAAVLVVVLLGTGSQSCRWHVCSGGQSRQGMLGPTERRHVHCPLELHADGSALIWIQCDLPALDGAGRSDLPPAPLLIVEGFAIIRDEDRKACSRGEAFSLPSESDA